jgi:hypothetical protein
MLTDKYGNVVKLPVTIGGVQYAPNIEALWSVAELSAIGLVSQADPSLAPTATPPAPVAVIPDPNAVPVKVTNYQARAALINAGLFAQADAAVRAANSPLTLSAWDYANDFYRASPFIFAMGSALSLSPAQVDALFVAANKIQ